MAGPNSGSSATADGPRRLRSPDAGRAGGRCRRRPAPRALPRAVRPRRHSPRCRRTVAHGRRGRAPRPARCSAGNSRAAARARRSWTSWQNPRTACSGEANTGMPASASVRRCAAAGGLAQHAGQQRQLHRPGRRPRAPRRRPRPPGRSAPARPATPPISGRAGDHGDGFGEPGRLRPSPVQTMARDRSAAAAGCALQRRPARRRPARRAGCRRAPPGRPPAGRGRPRW